MLSAQAVLTAAAAIVTGSSFTSQDQRQQHPMQGWPAQMKSLLHPSDLKKARHLLRQPQVVVANQVLYLDHESPDNERDLLTFRELFLHSYALENIIVGGYKLAQGIL